MSTRVQLADGQFIDFPAGTAPEVMDRAVQRYNARAATSQAPVQGRTPAAQAVPAATDSGSTVGNVLGSVGRGLVTGVTGLVDIPFVGAQYLTGMAARAAVPELRNREQRIVSLSSGANALADTVGVPRVQNEYGQVITEGLSGGATGAGVVGGIARGVQAVAPGLARFLGAGTALPTFARQGAVAGASGGVAGQTVADAGGGAGAQTAASIAAALLTPGAGGIVRFGGDRTGPGAQLERAASATGVPIDFATRARVAGNGGRALFADIIGSSPFAGTVGVQNRMGEALVRGYDALPDMIPGASATASADDVGRGVQNTVAAFKDTARNISDANYAPILPRGGGGYSSTPVNDIQPLLDALDATRNIAGPNASAAIGNTSAMKIAGAMQKDRAGGYTPTLRQILDAKAPVMQQVDSPSAVGGVAYNAPQIRSAFDDVIVNTIRNSPPAPGFATAQDAVDAYLDARNVHSDLMKRYDRLIDSFGGDARSNISPVQAINKLVGSLKRGDGTAPAGDIQKLRDFVDAAQTSGTGANVNAVAAHVLGKLGTAKRGTLSPSASAGELQVNVQKAVQNYASLSDEAKDLLFGPKTPGIGRFDVGTDANGPNLRDTIERWVNVADAAGPTLARKSGLGAITDMRTLSGIAATLALSGGAGELGGAGGVAGAATGLAVAPVLSRFLNRRAGRNLADARFSVRNPIAATLGGTVAGMQTE